jgi:UDP-2,3-diacylglucosamine hydrolase
MTIKNTLWRETFLIGHGDGKGPGDLGYKRMKKVFTNPFFQMALDGCIRYLETGAIPVRKNKLISGDEDVTFLGEDNEWLILYSKKEKKPNTTITLFFGHRHLPNESFVGRKCRVCESG